MRDAIRLTLNWLFPPQPDWVIVRMRHTGHHIGILPSEGFVAPSMSLDQCPVERPL